MINYHEYIHSEIWRARASEMIRKGGYKCSKCGNIGHLQCHHTRYTNLGNEKEGDLLVLCEACHKKIHKMKGGE